MYFLGCGGWRSIKTSSTSGIWWCGLDVWLAVGNFGKQVGVFLRYRMTVSIFWCSLQWGSLSILFKVFAPHGYDGRGLWCQLSEEHATSTVLGGRDKQLVSGPEWDSWIFCRPKTNVKVLLFPMFPGIKRNVALSEDSQCPLVLLIRIVLMWRCVWTVTAEARCWRRAISSEIGGKKWRGDRVFSECIKFSHVSAMLPVFRTHLCLYIVLIRIQESDHWAPSKHH